MFFIDEVTDAGFELGHVSEVVDRDLQVGGQPARVEAVKGPEA
jgi:hypothetical protein